MYVCVGWVVGVKLGVHSAALASPISRNKVAATLFVLSECLPR